MEMIMKQLCNHSIRMSVRSVFLVITTLLVFFAPSNARTSEAKETETRQEMELQAQSCVEMCEKTQHRDSDPTFKRNPPLIEKAVLKNVKSGEAEQAAELVIQFKPDARLHGKQSMSIQVVGHTVMLRRVTDAQHPETFAGTIAFDVQQFTAEQVRHARMAHGQTTVPLFANRQLVGREEISVVDHSKIFRERGELVVDSSLLHTLLTPAPDPGRELMITDLSVVNDPARTFDVCTNTGTPMGIWTFGHLMKEMANQPTTGIDPSDFVRQWLSTWENNQTVNGLIVVERSAGMHARILDAWPKLPNGKLDLAQSPFRLLAIVNRVDLRENLIYGGGSAGEARFIFGALDRSNCAGTQPFTVIFEYGIQKVNCPDLHAWAQQWHDLGSIVLGQPVFNVTLQSITDQFTIAGANPSKLPNKSALNQLRTNEIALGAPWELREFHVGSTGQLQLVTVKQTPSSTPHTSPVLHDQAVIRDYINANQASILAGTNEVPAQFPGTSPFLGGSSQNEIDFWNGAPVIASNDARRAFSLNTCNGCHGRETNTTFLQVNTRQANTAATLSGFLTGETVQDPVDGTPHQFNDLARRAQDMSDLLGMSCRAGGILRDIHFRPLRMTH